MDIFNAMKSKAYNFIIENDIKNLNFTSDQLIKLIEKYGYIVFDYDESVVILNRIRKTQETYRPGFTYRSFTKDERYVFYNTKLSEAGLIDVLMHELAHIYLGHPNKPDDCKTQEERDEEEELATAMTIHVFCPFCVLKEYGVKNSKELFELICLSNDEAFIWKYYCNYKITKEDEPIIEQFSDFLLRRRLIKSFNKALVWAIAGTAWITAGIMVLIYLFFLW